MTADVDPLKCLNSRAAGGPILCGAPVTDHCAACLACTWALNATCACPPLPTVGTQVMPKPGVLSVSMPVPYVPHTVVSTWDHRRNGEPFDYVITAQPTADVLWANASCSTVDTAVGAYLGLDDITILNDVPHIVFSVRETS